MDIEVKILEGKKVDAIVDGRTIMSDQSVEYGGEGTAPEPFDYFLASVALCSGVYASIFCKKRNISTDNIKISQKTIRDPEDRYKMKFEINIELPTDFPEKYKDALVKATELCTVTKVIQNQPEFEVRLV